ncbi:PREDICTED: dynamin-like protein ARC5 isoform X4 [Populus euphratica]|uniref:Dynamin-like protein ARC5 isoform X4 n=1 Tax=Populus euphratica TaxID=75702 RepID=A0AAJ6XZ38_POPEU|nr:PREDICTED: dynamin-like protein ARC5 isoform X4 [Populus euphratica]
MILNARSLLAILSLMMTLLFPRRNLSMKFRLILSSQRLLLAQLTREYPSLLAHLTLKYSFHCQLIHLMISWWPVGGSPFFTTLPSGRVGSAHDSVYSSNDEFKQNAGMRFYGGALYHHAMAEFCFVAGGINCPQITGEEIANACGVEDIHDGTNYSSASCL